jgi:hypothetical protein
MFGDRSRLTIAHQSQFVALSCTAISPNPGEKWRGSAQKERDFAPSRQSPFLETKRFKGFYFQLEAPEPNCTPS